MPHPPIRATARAAGRLAHCLIAIVAVVCAAWVPPAAAAPNMVVVMADDLDLSVWDTALAAGYLPRIRTELIDAGTTFTNAFVTESMCCPSRTTYLTGRYPHNHGVWRNAGGRGGFAGFAGDSSTVAVWLQQAGYRTGLIGKYLNGYGDVPSYVPPGWNTWNAVLDHLQFGYRMSIDGTLKLYGGAEADYQPDVLAEYAVQFLRVDDPRPFFLTVTPVAPHYEDLGGGDDVSGFLVRPAPRYEDTPDLKPISPETLASFNEADLSDKPRWMRSVKPANAPLQRLGYNSKVAAMRAVDDLVGRVIDELRARGVLENTLIVFTSDNGFQYGTHRLVQKTDLYEESVRIPTVIRAPGQEAARQSTDWIANNDWAPTFIDFAGASADFVPDGRSLKPVILGSGSSGRQTLLIELPLDPDQSAAKRGGFAALRSKDPRITGDPAGAQTLVYAQTYDKRGRVTDIEFYDLGTDPLQLASLHTSTDRTRREQLRSLAQRLEKIKDCAGVICRNFED